MASKQTIIETLYFGLIDYVPKKKLIDYKNEFSSRKTHNTKFALSFFPKYIDFDRAIKKPKQPYDTLLLNYWIIEVPNNGLKGSRLISDYEYGKNSITNKRIKAERNNVKTRTKLLLTKKQKEERRKKKLDLTKEPVLHGEVIRRIKSDPEYAAKIKAIAKKNSEKKLNYTEKLQTIERNKSSNFLTKEQQEPLEKSVNAQAGKKNTPYSSEQTENNEPKEHYTLDQLLDLIAKSVMHLVGTGLQTNDAIKQVVESIKEKFDFDINPDDVKAKLEDNNPSEDKVVNSNMDTPKMSRQECQRLHSFKNVQESQKNVFIKKEKHKINFYKLIKLILSLLFFGALFRMPYNYYETMRFLAMVGFIVLGYTELKNKNKIYMLIWFSSALLVNPFIKLAFGRTLWNIIDVFWILLLIFSIFHNKKD